MTRGSLLVDVAAGFAASSGLVARAFKFFALNLHKVVFF